MVQKFLLVLQAYAMGHRFAVPGCRCHINGRLPYALAWMAPPAHHNHTTVINQTGKQFCIIHTSLPAIAMPAVSWTVSTLIVLFCDIVYWTPGQFWDTWTFCLCLLTAGTRFARLKALGNLNSKTQNESNIQISTRN